MPSILITRPRGVAEPLAQELEHLGYRTVIESLLSITPLAAPRPDESFDVIIITSGSALLAIETRQKEIAGLFLLPCFCVGTRTADKARQFGFRHVQNAEGDGSDLARFMGPALPNKSASILHIAGRDADGKVQEELEQQGHRVHVWAVYEALPVKVFTEAARASFEKQQLDSVTVFSPRTAETLVKLVRNHALEACCASLAAICLSTAVADVLKPLSWRQIATASVPSEKALITRLQEICPVKS